MVVCFSFWFVVAGLATDAFGRALAKAPGLVSSLNDMTMVCQPIQECGGHLCVGKDTGPFAKAEVGGDDDAGSLVELG